MKVYKQRTETKTVTTTELVRRSCDLCDRTASNTREWADESTYEIGETELSVTVRQKEGTLYPECGFGKEYAVDLCPDCFKNRLIPWLISQGAKIEQKEWDW